MSALPVALAGGVVALLLALSSSGAKARTQSDVTRPEPKPKQKPAPKPKAKTSPPAPKPDDFTITVHDAVLIEDRTPDPKPEPKALTKHEAALELYSYVVKAIGDGLSSFLGDRTSANATVKRYQLAMGKIAADGIYGDKTRARGKELLGREFPARKTATAPKPAPSPAPTPKPAPTPPPDQRTPVQAARDLLGHVRAHGDLGTKARPSQPVMSAQRDMGELTTDGVYGPKTRARGKQLIGETFPPRT